jgi:TetR/AcrR family transcriptional regulator, tetracycline repressor protein
VAGVGGRVKAPGAVGDADWWRRQHLLAAARRPRPDGLTLDRITAAALALVAGGDLSDLTMRRLADCLGTQAGSLYRHVASREELLVHLLDGALAGLPAPQPGDWRAGAAQFSRDHRQVWLRRPALAPLLGKYPMLGPNSMRSRELALSHHLSHGYAPQDASEIYTLLTRLVLGSVAARIGRSRRLRPSAADRRALYAELPADEYPNVVSFASLSFRLSDDDIFAFMLEALLDRIEQHYPVTEPRSGA